MGIIQNRINIESWGSAGILRNISLSLFVVSFGDWSTILDFNMIDHNLLVLPNWHIDMGVAWQTKPDRWNWWSKLLHSDGNIDLLCPI